MVAMVMTCAGAQRAELAGTSDQHGRRSGLRAKPAARTKHTPRELDLTWFEGLLDVNYIHPRTTITSPHRPRWLSG
ncbi:MAG: hypothetical protein ABIY55_26975, partial [Kofleriaceae bacterium]